MNDIKEHTAYELKKDIINKACQIIKKEFTDTIESQSKRFGLTSDEITNIGNCLQALEIEILKKVKDV